MKNFRIDSEKKSKVLGLPLNYNFNSTDDRVAAARKYAKYRKNEDNKRFNRNILDNRIGARIVTKTWSRGGRSLRRGDVVFIKRINPNLADFMVSFTRSAQGFCWTCTIEEIEEHTELAYVLRSQRGRHEFSWDYNKERMCWTCDTLPACLSYDHYEGGAIKVYELRFPFEGEPYSYDISIDSSLPADELIERANSVIYNFQRGWRPYSWEF